MNSEVDLVVLGSGAAGMTAALTGAIAGLSVLLIEKSAHVGGTSALSAGSLWIPNSTHSPFGADSVDKAFEYLQSALGNRLNKEMVAAFLEKGPQMVEMLENQTSVRFRAYPYHPDYLAKLPGATLSGRVLEALPFDGRLLKEGFVRLRHPMPEFMLFGGMMVDRIDIVHLLNITKSYESLAHTAKLLLRYGKDRLRHVRGTRLVMGNALTGQLYHALLQQGVPILFDASVASLTFDGDRVCGVVVEHDSIKLDVRARAGVVLATGGFSRHRDYRHSLMPESLSDQSAVVESATGDGMELARKIGGYLNADIETGHGLPLASNSFWAPVSHRRRTDGTTAVFPHFVLDRGKPGIFAIDPSGKRFVNEATTYHLFGEALFDVIKQFKGGACYLICDDMFITKYGLGMVRPKRFHLKKALRERYVITARTCKELAIKLNLSPETLETTVSRHNSFALTGKDLDFNKGEDAYQTNLGDASHRPNPCIGQCSTAPYYALEIQPGDIGASAGLATDSRARVLRENGSVIDGLYACGNDMASIMAGVYPGPGITIGPGMTFGYSAAMHASEDQKKKNGGIKH